MYTYVASDVAHGVIARPLDRDVGEQRLYSHRPRIILHGQLLDAQRLHGRHVQLGQTLRQVRSQVVEALLYARV